MKEISRKAVLVVLLSVICSLVTSAQSQTSPGCEPSQRRQLSLNLTDKENNFIATLKTEDVTLAIDKTPAQVLQLETRTDQALAVVILIDASMSQQGTLTHTKLAAQKFVEWVLSSKRDRAAIVSFSGEATVEADLTNDPATLYAAINRIKPDRPADYGVGGLGRTPPIYRRKQGMTAMWDAVWASTDEILKPITDSRRVILLLTEGADNSSSSRWREAIEHTAVNDVAVFSIGVSDQKYFDIVGERNLEDLAEATGGRFFFLKKVQDLPGIFEKIERESRSRHLLSYCLASPIAPDTAAKIHLELRPELPSARLLYRRYTL